MDEVTSTYGWVDQDIGSSEHIRVRDVGQAAHNRRDKDDAFATRSGGLAHQWQESLRGDGLAKHIPADVSSLMMLVRVASVDLRIENSLELFAKRGFLIANAAYTGVVDELCKEIISQRLGSGSRISGMEYNLRCPNVRTSSRQFQRRR